MSELTSNYNLIKPQATDPINLLMTNPNWDTIDAKLKEASESGGTTVVVQSEAPTDINAIWIDTSDDGSNEVGVNATYDTIKLRTSDPNTGEPKFITVSPNHHIGNDAPHISIYSKNNNGEIVHPQIYVGEPLVDEHAATKGYVDNALETLQALPYGGSKEWLENNGDKTQLYQIDGYVWAYIESDGWTKSGTQFVVVSSEEQMGNEGGNNYLLRNGDKGTVYSYTPSSGDVGVPVYEDFPESANDGDIIAIKPVEVNSVEEMTDTTKQYCLKSTGTLWACRKVSQEIRKQIFDPSRTITGHMSGTSIASNANTLYLMPFDASEIPVGVTATIEINGFNLLNTTNPYPQKVGYSALESPAVGSNQILGSQYYATANIKTLSGNKGKYIFSAGELNGAIVSGFETSKTLLLEVDTSQTYDPNDITVYFSYPSYIDEWYDTGILAGRKYKATTYMKEVPNFTNLADPTSADWIVGFRLNSSGTLTEEAKKYVTNYIPCSMDDIVRVRGFKKDLTASGSAAWYYQLSKSVAGILYPTTDNFGNVTYDSVTDTHTIIAGHYGVESNGSLPKTAYLRLTGDIVDGLNYDDIIITVNEEIEYSTEPATKWTDVGVYVTPVESSWDATPEVYNIVDSLSDNQENGYTAVYSSDGYLYTYVNGALWMQSSKYNTLTLSVDGSLSVTSTNAIQNKAVAQAIDRLEIKSANNLGEINAINERIANIETGSGSISVPSFWQNAVSECIAKIKALQKDAGINAVTFPFFSDHHQRGGYAGLLIKTVMDACHIPYCFFGGDSISNGYIADEATMINQESSFNTTMSYIPPERFCRAAGNHDGYWNVSSASGDEGYYTRNQVFDLFFRDESISQNKHYGDDGTYFYVDDVTSKVRFIILNTNSIRDAGGNIIGSTFDSAQLTWLQNTALSFNEEGWAVIFISHQPISNHYHAGINNAAQVRSVIKNYINGNAANKADVAGWYSGHIHRDRIWTGAAVNTSNDDQGEAMGFTQVTITSDHTSIAYDDATKHTVANDDQSHAIDFVTINKATRTVNLTRLGVGEDRSYTY